MRIFAWTMGGSGNGSSHYRIRAPFTEIEYQGLARVRYGKDLVPSEHQGTDVVVVHKLGHDDVDTWVGAIAAPHRLLVVEHDDDYVNIRPDNPMFQTGTSYEWYVEHRLPGVLRSLERADLVTVSVPHLAEVYAELTDSPIVVLPNTVDEVLLQVPQPLRQPGERLRVGWAGSPSHALDWRVCGAGVRYGLAKADAHFVMMGADFRSVVGYRDTEFVPWADSIDAYYLPLTSWHVMVAPLVDDEFNRSKSPLKALEAAAFGIPTVAGDVRPYREFVVDGETGFLCRTDDDWMKALRTLAYDEELRREMGRKARERAARLTTQRWAGRWVEAYREALETKAGRLAASAAE